MRARLVNLLVEGLHNNIVSNWILPIGTGGIQGTGDLLLSGLRYIQIGGESPHVSVNKAIRFVKRLGITRDVPTIPTIPHEALHEFETDWRALANGVYFTLTCTTLLV